MSNDEPSGRKADEQPAWRDPEILRTLYVERGLSTRQIGSKLGVTAATITKYLRRSEIETRSLSEAQRARGRRKAPTLNTTKRGYEEFSSRKTTVKHHQLLAIAGGADPCKVFSDHYDVHHGPEANIPWANWPSNITVVPAAKHRREHLLNARRRDDSKIQHDEYGRFSGWGGQ